MSARCVQAPKDLILELMQRNDLKGFTEALSYYGSEIADSVYGFRSLLEEACCKERDAGFVRELLKVGVDVNYKNFLGQTALHFAVKQGNVDAMKELLWSKKSESVAKMVNAVDCEGFTALHALCALPHTDKDCYTCLEHVLLSVRELDVNRLTFMGKTAIYIAAEKMHKDIVQRLLQKEDTLIDIDLIDEGGAREKIIKNFPELSKTVNLKRKTSKTYRLIDLLHSDGKEKFTKTLEDLKKNGRLKEALEYENGPCTLLQRASQEGLEWAVEALLEVGVDWNETCPNNGILPSQLAAQFGRNKVLHILMGKGAKLEYPDGETALHYLLRFGHPEKENYKECFDKIINFKFHYKSYDANVPECYDTANKKGYTPLHLAAQYDYSEFVLSLLKKGAYIGSRKSEVIPPIAYISRDTLQEFLDSRVTSERARRDQGYKIKFDVRFLKDPSLSDHAKLDSSSATDSDREQGASNEDHQCIDIESDNFPSPEYICKPLLYISRLADIKDLLTHPVFKCFIYYKWRQMSHYYWIDLAIKSFFVTFITLYVLGFSPRAIEDSFRISVNNSFVSNESRSSQINDLNLIVVEEEITGNSRMVLWFLSVIFYIISLVQVFKMLAISVNDFFSLENILEISLIITSGIVLFPVTDDLVGNPHYCSITTLLSWTVLLLLIGKHPKLSTNIEMLKIVSRNFIYFLLWYLLLIIAFSLSFYALYRNSSENTLFTNVGASMFKTFVMVTGDFETDKHPMKDVLYTSQFIFLLFVFMVVIVLMNLLNALAVDDIHSIRKDSELLAIISRVNFIANMEKARKSICGRCYNFSSNVAQIWGSAKNLCLPSLAHTDKVQNKVFDGIISIYPNEDVPIKLLPDEKCSRGTGFSCISNRYDRINYSIIRDAEIILRRRKEKQREKKQCEKVTATTCLPKKSDSYYFFLRRINSWEVFHPYHHED